MPSAKELLYRATHKRPDTLRGPEKTDIAALQDRLTSFISQRLDNPQIRAAALDVLRSGQREALQMRDPRTGEGRAMNVSLLPVVISEETEDRLKRVTQIGNLARMATLMKMNEDPNLRAFFESGIDPLAVEVMRANPFTPAENQWRFRADVITDQEKGTMKVLENNGGEPQGDAPVADSIRLVERAMGVFLDIPADKEVRLSPYPERQMMEVLIGRYQEVTGTQDLPTIGYLAWKGRSAISDAEAKFTAERYGRLYGQDSTQFDPTDIVDIEKRTSKAGKPYYVVVTEKQTAEGQAPVRTEIDMVRRLHGEPMENMELWRDFKDNYGKNMCSDGEESIWDRFTTKLGSQMINPLNSYATDKKLDVVLGNPDFMEHFGIWKKMREIVKDKELVKTLSITDETRRMVFDGSVRQFMLDTFPQAYMLRTKADGLYDGDNDAKDLGLSKRQIKNIKENRDNWVLKRDSLAGHSGTSVHVGKSPLLEELDLEDYLVLSDREVGILTGLTKRELEGRWLDSGMSYVDDPGEGQRAIRATIVERVAELPESERKILQDRAWGALVDNSLKRTDSLVQQNVTAASADVPAIIFEEVDGEMVPVKKTMHWDIDPQSIGGGVYTHHMLRLTTAVKTNVSGGYGGLGASIKESIARKMLDYVDQNSIQ